MPVFHVELLEGVPVECRPPLLRRCFALHAAMGSIVRDGQVDSQEFACLFSAALGSSLPSSIGVPKPSQCNTAPDWIAYGDSVERWALGRGGKGYDFLRWQNACEQAWNAISELLPLPEEVEEAAAPFVEPVASGSDG